MQLTKAKAAKLQKMLDAKRHQLLDDLTHHAHAQGGDPVGLLYQYKQAPDIEVAALIIATLSYGQQVVFKPILAKIMGQMGSSPHDFLLSSKPSTWWDTFGWFKYRFNLPEDLVCLFASIRKVLRESSSLEAAFMAVPPADDVYQPLYSFVDSLHATDFREALQLPKHYGKVPDAPDGYYYLVTHPKSGSACKRLNLFLRWMLRKDEVDLGAWSGVELDKLIIPLDTHVGRISYDLGLTQWQGGSWAVAKDITDSLKQLDAEDPLKYDFVICSMGIWGEM